MLRSTRNEFFIGFTISVILSLFANFTLLIRRYNLMMDSKVAGFSFEWEKYELWFSVFWFFVFSFALFLLYRWVYKWGNKIFRREEIKVIGFTMGIVLVVALGLIRLYPVLNKLVIGKIYNNVSGISGIFKSFGDSPDGFKGELQEVMVSIGAEYSYNEQFFLRGGYFYENANKGNRQYFSVGAGFRMSVFQLDAAYLVSTVQSNPLDQTLRFTLSFDMDGIKNLFR
jgi:hypothetical protein